MIDSLNKDEQASQPVDLNRRDAERAHDQIHEQANKVNEGTVNLGQIAIRNIVLVNGGAAVTVLAFIGGLASQGRVSVAQLGDIAGNLTLFAVGVALAALSLGLSYLTNLCHVGSLFSRNLIWTPPYVEETATSKRWTRCSRILHVFTVIVGLVALAVFVVGMVDVRNSITRLGDKMPVQPSFPDNSRAR